MDTKVGPVFAIPSPKSRRTVRLTAEGWGWLAISTVLWSISFYKGINLLLLLSYLMLLLLVLNAVLARRQVRGVTVRRPVVGPLFAGEPVDIELAIDCPRPAPPLGIRVEDKGEAHMRQWFFDRLERRARCWGSSAVMVPRRGWYGWGPARVISGYPLGLVERALESEPARPMLVYPALGRLNRARFRRFLQRAAPGPGDTRQPPRRHPAAQGEFHGLREFRAGDSPRWVHWRTSARRGTLMVREFEDPPPDDLILVCEPWLPTAGRIEDCDKARQQLERMISLAATICADWCRCPGDRLVLAVAGACDPIILDGPTGPTLEALTLECLALVPGGAVAEKCLIGKLASRLLPRAPLLFLSTRAPTTGDALAQRLGRPVIGLTIEDLEHWDFYHANVLAQPAGVRG